MPTSFAMQEYVIKRAASMGYSLRELLSKSRLADLIRCKHLIILELRNKGFSLNEVCDFFGYSDAGAITYIQRKLGRQSFRKNHINQCLTIPSTW